MLAIVVTLKHFHPYLQSIKFIYMYWSSDHWYISFHSPTCLHDNLMGWLVSRFLTLVFHLVHLRQCKHSTRSFVMVAWLLYAWHNYTVPELLDHLHITQNHDTTLQKYWLLACGTHADYSTIYNSMGVNILPLRGDYMCQKIWYRLFYTNIMMLEDILGSSRLNRWSKTNFIGHKWQKKYESIVEYANNASYSKWIHKS